MKQLVNSIFLAILFAIYGCVPAMAQDLSALARFDPVNSSVHKERQDLVLKLNISQPVPFRVFTLANPPRFVVDFREIDWGNANPNRILHQNAAKGIRVGQFRDGWSRLVLDLNGPMAVTSATIRPSFDARSSVIAIRLAPVSQQEFIDNSGGPEQNIPPVKIAPPPRENTRTLVVIDPGHGGIDPGAERDGVSEAALMLGFARSLKDELIRNGQFDVVLTRDSDQFVPLEMRVSLARAANADVFISFHADILEIGAAAGATVYTLADKSTDEATDLLVERHRRDDILAGVDLETQGDEIAKVLIDLARVENTPRTEKLALELVEGLRASIGRMHRKPLQSGGFTVLKAADFPSVLIELGFMSDDADFANLRSENWRARAALGIRIALEHWAVSDAALRKRLRQ